jgi:hypothetical protein
MYSTCLFCHGSLGGNQALETFPVGRQLAFDGERGRLWVICPRCHRWNLSPLEVRWEAIEECERAYRDARLKVSTEQVGMARLRDGTELVRVGRPPRPEIAAWRWGDRMGVRRRRALVRSAVGGTVAVGTAAAAVAAGVATLGAAAPVLALAVTHGGMAFMAVREYGTSLKVPGAGGRARSVFRGNLKRASLRPGEAGDGWQLHLPYAGGTDFLEGPEARRALGVLLPKVNPWGARLKRVLGASGMLEETGGAERLLRVMAEESRRREGDFADRHAAWRRGDDTFRVMGWSEMRERGWDKEPINRGALPRLEPEERLALEMAVHEESERRAMEGELKMLEAAWREAEEIAAIADRLVISKETEETLERMRREVGRHESRRDRSRDSP